MGPPRHRTLRVTRFPVVKNAVTSAGLQNVPHGLWEETTVKKEGSGAPGPPPGSRPGHRRSLLGWG